MADVRWLMKAVARQPGREIVLDLEKGEVCFGDRTIAAAIPDGARRQLVTGTWNATGVLLEAGEAIERVARSLPYIRGF
jgi:3-isopropylmalate dehydratase small subunit